MSALVIDRLRAGRSRVGYPTYYSGTTDGGFILKCAGPTFSDEGNYTVASIAAPS